MNDTRTLLVYESDINERIDKFISENIEDLTRSSVQGIIENGGVIIRIPASQINVYKRDVQGVIVMRIEEGNQVVSLERVENMEEETEETAE